MLNESDDSSEEKWNFTGRRFMCNWWREGSGGFFSTWKGLGGGEMKV